MIHAELCGKLSLFEDVLTSDVFGALRYLHPNQGVIPFLNHVLEQNGASLRLASSGEVVMPSAVEYVFWPTGVNREPDVLVQVRVPEGTYAFVFEAKYKSGPSDTETDDMAEGNPPRTADTNEQPPKMRRYRYQLADQFRDLVSESPYRSVEMLAPVENRYLVYITSHVVKPEETLRRSNLQLHEAHQDGSLPQNRAFVETRMLWTSWHDVWQVLSTRQCSDFPFNLVLKDTVRLLCQERFDSSGANVTRDELQRRLTMLGRDYWDAYVTFEREVKAFRGTFKPYSTGLGAYLPFGSATGAVGAIAWVDVRTPPMWLFSGGQLDYYASREDMDWFTKETAQAYRKQLQAEFPELAATLQVTQKYGAIANVKDAAMFRNCLQFALRFYKEHILPKACASKG